jgi:hypothetical protein
VISVVIRQEHFGMGNFYVNYTLRGVTQEAVYQYRACDVF